MSVRHFIKRAVSQGRECCGSIAHRQEAHGTGRMTDNLDLRGVEDPELVFALVGALGTPMQKVVSVLTEELRKVTYDANPIHLSRFLAAYELDTPHPSENDRPAARWAALMDRGDQLRVKLGRGDALAMHAAAAIHLERPTDTSGSRALPRKAFILRQLKHPDEALLLRQVYGDAFHLVGVDTPYRARSEYLRNVHDMSDEEAEELLKRDAGDELKLGQQVTKTFHLADLFIKVSGWDDESVAEARAQIERYLAALFGRRLVTPSEDEYGMFLASSAALKSADLSRQVGAAILSDTGEVLGLGANEVPRAGGGQYWEGDDADRDVERGYDSNEVIKYECLEEVLAALDPKWSSLDEEEKCERLRSASDRLDSTRIMNLTEFGRAVHAEMEAILSAARIGVSIRGCTLYTTTFPCHNCAKHIVGGGVRRVVYVEPYAKSLADRLHGDSIAFALESEGVDQGKVPFSSFHGVAPRRFRILFSSVDAHGIREARKEKGGAIRTKPVGLRIYATPLTHIDREALVAQYLDEEMKALAEILKETADE